MKTARITGGFKHDVINLIIIHHHTNQKKKLELLAIFT